MLEMAQRGNFGSYNNGPATGSSPRDGVSAASDFTRLSQVIGNNVQKITQNVSQIQTILSQLGTTNENPALRDKLHEVQHYTNQLAKDTNKYMKDLNHVPLSSAQSEQRQQKMQRERLVNEFSKALNSFQLVQRQVKETDKAGVARARASSTATYDPFADALTGYQSADVNSSRQQVIQIEADVDAEVLHEREEALRKLETDIMDVNQIFKDLGMLVYEQGEIVDSIEANVETAGVSVEQGTEQLRQARDYQSKARRKKCCIITIVLVIVGIIIIILAVTLAPKK